MSFSRILSSLSELVCVQVRGQRSEVSLGCYPRGPSTFVFESSLTGTWDSLI